MQVRMTQQITGSRDGVPWPPAGGAVDLPDAEANDLVLAGLAVLAAPRPEAGENAAGNDDAAPADDADEAPTADEVKPTFPADTEAPAKPKRARAAKKATA